MPKATPDFLAKMLKNLTYGEAVVGKNGNLILTKSEDGRYVTARHFGTLILWLDLWNEGAEKVVFHYGESATDARYINAIFNHLQLRNLSAHYGRTNGWLMMFRGEENKPVELPYMEEGTFDDKVLVAEVKR